MGSPDYRYTGTAERVGRAQAVPPALGPPIGPAAQYSAEHRRMLLLLAILPCVDGFLLVSLVGDLWPDPLYAVGFGLAAFSGAGCVTATLQIPGRWYQRLAYVGFVYVLVGASAFG